MTSILFEIERIHRSRFKRNYLETKHFFLFFCYFWNVHQILNTLNKQMIVIATLLRKLQAVKDLVRPLSKKQCFRTPFDSEHVKQYQTLVQSA